MPQMTVCSSLKIDPYSLINNTRTERALKLGNYCDEGWRFENEFLVGSQDGYHDDFCCPPVVDSSTWLGVIGGIAVVTFFLRQSITMNLGKRRRKRKAALEEGLNHSKIFN